MVSTTVTFCLHTWFFFLLENDRNVSYWLIKTLQQSVQADIFCILMVQPYFTYITSLKL